MMKTCGTCKETKPYDMFSKHKHKKDGLQSQCKACEKAYREANKEKRAERMKAYYEANKDNYAEQQKAYREANKERIAEYAKAYREANKEKISERNKAYYEANKEKIAEYWKAYYEGNKDKIKAYYEANKDKKKAYREANKEKRAEYWKAYREANKERSAEKCSRRRARKRNAVPKFLRNCEIEKQRLQDIYKLRQLISEVTGIEHHVDHMWPLSKGGPHWSGNLQIITAQENLSKNDNLCKTLKKNIRDSLRIARKEYNEDRSNGHRD